jgi:hypothetical protein
MAAPKRQWLSAGRCMAFALWAVEHRELAEDVHAVRAAMRCTEPQAHALMLGLREARKRPARPPKARAVRRRALRAAAFEGGGMLQRLNAVDALSRPLSPAEMQDAAQYFAGFRVVHGSQPEQFDVEPDVAAYVAASVRAAELRAQAAKPARCFDGHRTCQHAHLGIGGQCEAGRCLVHEHDRQVAAGVEFPAHG